jgi:hypothetical protein
MQNSAHSFVIQGNLSLEEQIAYCKKIIFKYRDEVQLLRKDKQKCEHDHTDLEEQIKEWEKQYGILQEKVRGVEKENGKLKKEIEKLTKTNERYRVALFDHGNFKSPDKKERKRKGGQYGHANTNNDSNRDYQSFSRQRIFTQTCGGCGNPLTRVASFKEKILIDIQINTQVLQSIIESERQWCSNCQKEIRVSHDQSLPFSEYGMNTFMVVMHLRFKGKQSIRTIAVTLSSIFGLAITKSGVLRLLFQAKEYLGERYEELKEAIRKSEVMYNDETGWSVRGQFACMWIMATNDKKQADGKIQAGITIYVATESKGKGIFKEMYGKSKSYSMHDGNPSYEAVTGEDRTLYCWSHVLRFIHEETVKLEKTHLACQIKDRLVTLYQTIRLHREWTKEQKEKVLREELDSIIDIKSDNQTVKNIQYRIETQREGLILALLVTEDGTNNLGEREFRQLAISRNISYGSDTYGGMETTAILSSIVQTIHRDKTKLFLPTLKSYLQEGIKKKYPQYKHIPLFDT